MMRPDRVISIWKTELAELLPRPSPLTTSLNLPLDDSDKSPAQVRFTFLGEHKLNDTWPGVVKKRCQASSDAGGVYDDAVRFPQLRQGVDVLIDASLIYVRPQEPVSDQVARRFDERVERVERSIRNVKLWNPFRLAF
jgi:hypothetical protein